MFAPPLFDGAVKLTVALVVPVEATVTPVGEPGTVLGVADVAVDAVPAPTAFTALIWTLYAVPLTKAAPPLVSVVMTKGLSVVPLALVVHNPELLIEY